MCMCGKPTINGEPGYSWDGVRKGVYPVNPPEPAIGDVLLYDEPGRCGGLDSHSHHVRLVKSHGRLILLVRHGGGDERINLGCVSQISLRDEVLSAMDSNARYWLLKTIYSVHREATSEARESERAKWLKAAAEKRIKTRKLGDKVKVWIDTDKDCVSP